MSWSFFIRHPHTYCLCWLINSKLHTLYIIHWHYNLISLLLRLKIDNITKNILKYGYCSKSINYDTEVFLVRYYSSYVKFIYLIIQGDCIISRSSSISYFIVIYPYSTSVMHFCAIRNTWICISTRHVNEHFPVNDDILHSISVCKFSIICMLSWNVDKK